MIDFKKYQTIIWKLENTNHIPILAQNDFKLGSVNVLVLKSAFKSMHNDLVKKVDTIFLKYKKNMKEYYVEQAKREQMIKQSEIKELLALAYCVLATIMCAIQDLNKDHVNYLFKPTIDSASALVLMCLEDNNTKYVDTIYQQVNKI